MSLVCDSFVFECANCDFECTATSRRQQVMVVRLHGKKCTMAGRTKDGELQVKVEKLAKMMHSIPTVKGKTNTSLKEWYDQDKDGNYSSHVPEVIANTQAKTNQSLSEYKDYVMLGAAHCGDTRSYDELVKSCT